MAEIKIFNEVGSEQEDKVLTFQQRQCSSWEDTSEEEQQEVRQGSVLCLCARDLSVSECVLGHNPILLCIGLHIFNNKHTSC